MTGVQTCALPIFHRLYDHQSPSHLPYDHTSAHIADSHLESLLGGPLGRAGEVALLKMAAQEAGQEDEVNGGGDGYPSPHHHHHPNSHAHQDKLMDTPTPLSPIISKVTPVGEAQGMVGMTFAESPWETMEWLDLTPPSSATAFSVAPPNTTPPPQLHILIPVITRPGLSWNYNPQIGRAHV